MIRLSLISKMINRSLSLMGTAFYAPAGLSGSCGMTPRKNFGLLAAQTKLGEAIYAHYGLKSGDYDTNLLIQDGALRIKSDGSIAMCEILGGGWRLYSALRIFPRFLRDPIYDLVARNRLKWFGARETCFVPAPEDADRFL